MQLNILNNHGLKGGKCDLNFISEKLVRLHDFFHKFIGKCIIFFKGHCRNVQLFQ